MAADLILEAYRAIRPISEPRRALDIPPPVIQPDLSKPRKVWSAAGPWTAYSGYQDPVFKSNGKIRRRHEPMSPSQVRAMDRRYINMRIEACEAGMTVAEYSRTL